MMVLSYSYFCVIFVCDESSGASSSYCSASGNALLPKNARRPRIFRDRGNPLDVLNDEEFRQRFRMTRPMFFELVNGVQFDLKYDTKTKPCTYSCSATDDSTSLFCQWLISASYWGHN